MELIIKHDVAKLLPAEIEFNYDDLKSKLTEFVEKYKSKTVTQDTIREGKSDCAGLNRLKYAFEEARKREKQKCIAPYLGFEAKVKELVGIIESARANIDSQVKAFENARKERKAALIREEFDGSAADIAPLVPFERLFNPKWLNSGAAESAWRKELADKIESIRAGLKAVGEVIPESYRKEAMAKFIETFNFPAVFSFVETRRKQDAILEAQRRESAREEEPKMALPPARHDTSTSFGTDATEGASAATNEPIYTCVLCFHGTMEALVALKAYMKQNGIAAEKFVDGKWEPIRE